jgi:hypothetical protein
MAVHTTQILVQPLVEKFVITVSIELTRLFGSWGDTTRKILTGEGEVCA